MGGREVLCSEEHANLRLLVGSLTVRCGASASESGSSGSCKIPCIEVKLSTKLDRTGNNDPLGWTRCICDFIVPAGCLAQSTYFLPLVVYQ